MYFQDVSIASVRIGLAGPASLPTNPVGYGTLQEEGESFKGKIAEKIGDTTNRRGTMEPNSLASETCGLVKP